MKTSQLDRVVQENDRLKRRNAEAQQLLDTAHDEALKYGNSGGGYEISTSFWASYRFRKEAGDAELLRKEKSLAVEELERLKQTYSEDRERHAEEVATFKTTVETQRLRLKRLESLHNEIERIDVVRLCDR